MPLSFPKRHRHHPDNSGIRRKFKSARHFNFTVFASRLFADKHDAAVSPSQFRAFFVGVWPIFLARCNPLNNSLLRSSVILSDSEVEDPVLWESGLRPKSIFRRGTDFSFITQMLRPQGTQHDTRRLVCQKIRSHPFCWRAGNFF